MRTASLRTWVLFVWALPTASLFAQAPGERLLKIQKEKMAVLERLDGNWRGTAKVMTPEGNRIELVQTERVGPLLDGAVKVIEGSGFDAAGTKHFNALGIITFDPQQGQYQMRSYAQGRLGDFKITITETGFTWEIPAGPATIRYMATVTDTTWKEVGQRIVQGQEPIPFIEMDLKKIGQTDWPAGNPIALE